ncbi:MAG: ABC transporter ATP-binding protein [Deltaproteobacteria bacterium]|nr:ABC transporter ATP-binding protein [Deltaproteobacteria bacterium]
MNVYLRLLAYLRPYWVAVAGAMFCMIVYSLTQGAGVFLVGPAVAYLFDPESFDAATASLGKWNIFKQVMGMWGVSFFPVLVAAIIIIFTVKGVADFGQAYLMGGAAQRVLRDVRNRLFAHLESLPIRFYTHKSTGELMSRITNDVALLQGAVSDAVAAILRDASATAVLVALAFAMDVKMALIACVVFPVAVIPIVRLGKRLRRASRRKLVSTAKLSTLIHEMVRGIRIVKGFAMEKWEARKFEGENNGLYRTNLRAILLKAAVTPLNEFLAAVGFAVTLWYGQRRIAAGTLLPHEFITFFVALGSLYPYLKKLASINNVVQEGIAGATRVFEILDERPEPPDSPDAVPLKVVREGVSFEDVYFKYEDEMVLKGINFRVGVGEIVALVGASGGGKTTIANLIPRFYAPTSGQVTIDGQDLSSFTVGSLRRQVGIVTQQTILFNDTVANNIAYGEAKPTRAEIEAAARAAHAHDFIERMPDGYNSVVGEGGVWLSGGEAQRLSVARAILKDAPILILDEATSSLDADSEAAVQKALDNLLTNRTTLVIAHRLSTIRHASRILVILSGEIVEEGTHEELLEHGTEYKRLYEKQFRVDEIPEHAPLH